MRAIVVSDSHGGRLELRYMLEELWPSVGPVDAYVHCGDGANDLISLTSLILQRDPKCRLFCVSGNCDFARSLQETLEFELGGVKVFLCHGHQYGVKNGLAWLDSTTRNRGCSVALYGHTHEPHMEMRQSLLLNPGSVMQGRSLILEAENGKMTSIRMLEHGQ